MTRPSLPRAARSARRGALAGAALLLGGCVGFSPDGGMSDVVATVGPELGASVAKVSSVTDDHAVQVRVAALHTCHAD